MPSAWLNPCRSLWRPMAPSRGPSQQRTSPMSSRSPSTAARVPLPCLLALREPKYQETAAYCHFGREAVTKGGIKFFEWENAKDLAKYRSMNSAQVDAELKASNYLTKWVD